MKTKQFISNADKIISPFDIAHTIACHMRFVKYLNGTLQENLTWSCHGDCRIVLEQVSTNFELNVNESFMKSRIIGNSLNQKCNLIHRKLQFYNFQQIAK